jgi:hypothetical protein
MSYFSKFQQNIVVSTLNTSTGILAAGGTYTGTVDSTLGIAGIQVNLYADQNCTVYVDQSPDTTPTGPHWDISDSYTYYASSSFGITVQATNSYFRVRVVNNNASAATTVFRITSILCPIVEAVPRTLDAQSNFKVGIKSIQDLYGFGVENTPIGEMRVVEPVRLVGASFDGTTVDPNFWAVTNTAGGTTTQANAQVVLATNTTSPNGATVLTSIRRGRYVSASGMVFRVVVQLSTGVTNNKRRWGIAWGATMPAITDGAYFELDGSTFSIVTNKGTSEARISSGSFNGKLGLTYDPGITVHTYEIYWTNSKVWFIVSDQILHTVSASSATWSATMSHYVYMDNVNSGGITSNNTLTCRVASIRRLGPLISQPTSKFTSGTQTAAVICKYGAGNLHGAVVHSGNNSAVLTIYDGTTTGGTILYQSLGIATGAGVASIDFQDLPFYTGLCYTCSNNINVTLIYE